MEAWDIRDFAVKLDISLFCLLCLQFVLNMKASLRFILYLQPLLQSFVKEFGNPSKLFSTHLSAVLLIQATVFYCRRVDEMSLAY